MNKSDFFSTLEHSFAINSIALPFSSDLSDRLFAATEMILEKNKVMNLTAICSEDEFIYRHWTDALTAVQYIPDGASLLDVGTGAGILAIAYASARPDIKVTALDSTSKKTDFVSECASSLGLANLKTVSARAEELSRNKNHRSKYDFVCARAVASLPVLCELCIPFVKIGGIFCALKGKNGADELSASADAITGLGGKLKSDNYFQLCENIDGKEAFSERHLILIEKSFSTPDNFPRRFAQITKSPL